MSIPPIIHQIWWQGYSNIPIKMLEYRKTWKKNHKSFRFILWNRQSFENLLYILNNPLYNTIYHDLPIMIQKIDFCKYIVLYHYGGIYVDMDTISEKPLGSLLNISDLVVSKLIIYKHLNIKLINNGVLFAKPRHVFFNYVLLEIYYSRHKKLYQTNDLYIMETTGPLAFTRATINYIQSNPNITTKNITILNPKYFESYTLDDNKKSKGLYITHIHNISWASGLFKLHFYITKYYHKNYIILLFIIYFIIYLNKFINI